MSLEWVHVSRGAAVCETDELRDLADDPALVGDDEIGVLLDSGDGDGALLYGDELDQLIAVLECAIGNVRAVKVQRGLGVPLGRCGCTKGGQHVMSDDGVCEACGEPYELG